MKKWFIHILLLAGLFGMLTTSCSQDEEIANIPSAGTPSEKVTIRFTLDLGEQGGMSSRATWEGYDEDDTDDRVQAVPGIDNENYINTSSLQVFMFNLDGAYIGGLKDMEAERQGESNIYNIKGEVDVVKTAIGTNEVLNCKIMVVANADAASVESGKVTDFNNEATFNHNVSYIPMWGIGTYSINLIQQLQVDLDEPIYMLRSMAKIEVTLNQTIYDEGYRITSATLNKYNTQGYVVPTLPVTGDNPVVDWRNLTNTTSLSTANVFRENKSLAETASSPTPKSFAASEAGKSYVIYVPEYDNKNELTITLGLTHNSTPIFKEGTTPYTISLNEYKLNVTTGKSEPDTEKPLDLVRNHWYKYTINSISDGAELELDLTVDPWDYVEESMSYTENPSTSTHMIWGDGTKYDEEDKSIVLLNNNFSNAAICTFALETPVGGTWHVSLEGDSDAFIFVDQLGSPLKALPSGKVGENATLRIKTAKSNAEATAKLIITVEIGGRYIVAKELLPNNIADYYTLKQNNK